ncbi:MAG: beta-galactosidase, partial [Planctomycetota bacterium]
MRKGMPGSEKIRMKTKVSSALCLCCFLAAGTLYANDKSSSELDTDVFPYRFNVDGKSTLPQMFFFNTDKGDDTYLRPQVEMASKAGVHIYSFPLSVPMKYPTDEPNFAHAEKLLEKFIAIDPQAQFLVRLVLGPNWSWRKYHERNASNSGEYSKYADGTTSRSVPFASEDFLEPTSIQLRKIVRHFEKQYPDRMLVYHVAAGQSEFFDIGYRQKGPDYSEANTVAFRKHLKDRYKDVAALRKAWGDDNVSFTNAGVPMPERGRFPMRLVLDKRIRAFYRPVEERAWIDYSQFYSKLLSDHLIRWCRIVKEETRGNRMTAAF